MRDNLSVRPSVTNDETRSKDVQSYITMIKERCIICELDPTITTTLINLLNKYSYFDTIKIDYRNVPTAEVFFAINCIFRDVDNIYEVFRVVENRYAKGLIRNKPAYLLAALYNKGLGL